jgi:UDP-glucose 4-epimerase
VHYNSSGKVSELKANAKLPDAYRKKKVHIQTLFCPIPDPLFYLHFSGSMKVIEKYTQPGGRFFQANIINTKGIIMIPVAISTGCITLKSSGTPIARR